MYYYNPYIVCTFVFTDLIHCMLCRDCLQNHMWHNHIWPLAIEKSMEANRRLNKMECSRIKHVIVCQLSFLTLGLPTKIDLLVVTQKVIFILRVIGQILRYKCHNCFEYRVPNHPDMAGALLFYGFCPCPTQQRSSSNI